MITGYRTLILTTVFAAFFGMSDYGSQMVSMVTGNNHRNQSQSMINNISNITNDNETNNDDGYFKYVLNEFNMFKNDEDDSAKFVVPPRTHGLEFVDGVIIFIVAFSAIAVLCKLLNMITLNFFKNNSEPKKHANWFSWHIVSILITSIMAVYGVSMTNNVFSMFWYEVWTVFNTCGISGFFFYCPVKFMDHYVPLHDMTPVTQQMILGMDYLEYSSQIIVVSILMVAYCVYDIVFNHPAFEYIFHHILTITCIGIYAYTETYAFYVVAGMATELSTGILSSTALMTKKNRFKVIMMIEFAFTFFICRILLIPTVIMMAWLNEKNDRFTVIATAYGFLGALNFCWFYLIIKKVIRTIKEYRSKSITDVE